VRVPESTDCVLSQGGNKKRKKRKKKGRERRGGGGRRLAPAAPPGVAVGSQWPGGPLRPHGCPSLGGWDPAMAPPGPLGHLKRVTPQHSASEWAVRSPAGTSAFPRKMGPGDTCLTSANKSSCQEGLQRFFYMRYI